MLFNVYLCLINLFKKKTLPSLTVFALLANETFFTSQLIGVME